MWFFSSFGGILELRWGIQASSCVGPGKSNLPLELRERARDCSRVTSGQKRPHLSLCPGPNVPLQGRQRSRGCILDAPEESDLISRGRKAEGSNRPSLALPKRSAFLVILRVKVGGNVQGTIRTSIFSVTEKAMATHSSVLAWRIAGMVEPGGLPSMGSHRVGHD